MSNEDVIELGSSDEETIEPAPKKRKPMPNAMVCIPSKLHEVTIQPAKSPAPKVFPGKPINNQNILNAKININNKNILKGKPVSTIKMKPRLACNPYAEQKRRIINQIKPCNSSVTFTKLPSQKCIIPKNQNKGVPQILKVPTQIQNVNKINLPSSITVKRTVASRPIVTLNVKNKKHVNPTRALSNEVLTVELDDDEVSAPCSNSPQWYIRPEDQQEVPICEEENNKEPDTAKFIEITIEDSPVKPSQNKRTNQVRSTSAIVIEDSPVKAVADKTNIASGSENEDEGVSNEEPQSKKKLEYSRDIESNKTIEIEIDDLNEVSVSIENNENEKSEEKVPNKDQIQLNETSKEQITAETMNDKKTEVENNDLSEFHPIYQSFINLCFQLENSDDMQKIVEKKVKGYYRQVPKEYTESEEFTDLVSSKMLSMKAGPENMYLYIKDIVDELNMQRKLAKSQPVSQEPKTEEPTQLYGEKSNYDSKRERQIRKLEKTIKKLHRAIQKLEDQEVDFDDDDDSVYLLTERYKERMVRVYAKFCQLSNTKMPSEPRIILDARPGQPTGPAKKLEKWINKKVPIGTPLPFPDFHDVLRCVREANEEDKLGFNEADVMEEARDLFVRCGKKLQRRRQENEWRLAASRITVGADPAENNIELQKKLSENKKIAAQKENDIFNKFADRQNQLKLEGEEIGDKEAEESPVESEDEEEINNQTVSLENTERRKERLKRLIQEQCKKSNEEGVVQTSNENQNNKKTDLKIETCVQENNTIPEENVKDKEIVPENVTKSKADIIDNETAKTATVANKSESSKAKAKNLLSEKNDKKDDGNHNAEQSTNNDNCSQNTETFTLSDDSDELESDIDELHLLQRLHKSNADESSSVDTSDSDSPIAISDSLDSGEDNRKMIDDDVISIENSSYSEDELDSANTDNVQSSKEDTSCVDKEMISTDDNAMDVEFHSVKDIEVPSYATNDKDKNDIEDILLASTEEDNSGPADGVCFNLEDDLISIDETVVCAKKETNVTVVNPTSTNIYKQSGVCKQIETNTESNQISTDDLTINSIESNCKSSQETDIPVDNPITTKLDEGDEKCNQYEENAESNETPTDVLTINSVDSNCISPEETDIPVDNLNTTILDIDSDKCSQGEEYSQGNEIPTDDLTSNSIESNCELLEESSHKNGDVFVNDNALSGSNALDNQDVPGEDGDKYSQEENIKEIATDGLSIKFIESNCEVSEEISGKNCDVVFVEDHSNEFVENMDVDDDNNKMKILKDQEANVFTRRTEIS